MAHKLFKEEAAKIILKLNDGIYTYARCVNHGLQVQDLLLVQDTEILEKVLGGHKFDEITLSLKYDILDEIPVEEPDQCIEETMQFPDDIDESELMEMLTEVMSIMLFNKDE